MAHRLRYTLVATLAALVLAAMTLVSAQVDDDATSVEFTGNVESISGATAIINGQIVDASTPQLFTLLRPGQTVTVRGTLQPGGRILATQVVILTGNAQPPTPIPIATLSPSPQTGAQVIYPCPRGTGFWLRRPDAWMVDTVQLGEQVYTRDQLEQMLSSPVREDASIVLARQLIAAKMNVANGSNPEPAGSIILQADTILSRFEAQLPYNLDPASPVGEAMVTFAGALQSYNRRLVTPDCGSDGTEVVDEEDEDDADDENKLVVIEGPVQAIDGNVITIYGITILLSENIDLVDELQIGDLVRVEGFFAPESDTLLLLANSIVYVDLDVNIVNTGDSSVRADDGSGNGNRNGNGNGNANGNSNGNSSGRGRNDEGSGSRGNGSGRGNGNGNGNSNGNSSGRGSGRGDSGS